MIPKSVAAALWSYNLDKIDTKKHKKIIIAQVLNFGNKEAIDWLFQTYTKDEIKKTASQIPSGQWDAKSLNFWSKVFNIKPLSRKEAIYGAK